MEHVVSRADLLDTGSSLSSSPEPDALERFRAAGQFDFVTSTKPRNDRESGDIQDEEEEEEEEEEEGLEFQLFAAPKCGVKTKDAKDGDTHRIRLKSPSVDPEMIGFLRPHRNQNYYFATPLIKEEQRVALGGDQVIAHATSPWPGSAYAWKVLHLPPSSDLSEDLRSSSQALFPRLLGNEQEGAKRTRPGKKYRLKLRKRAEEGVRRKEERREAEEAKEAAEREKRTRRNREKKVKRKAKEKAKKEGSGRGEVDVEGEDVERAG